MGPSPKENYSPPPPHQIVHPKNVQQDLKTNRENSYYTRLLSLSSWLVCSVVGNKQLQTPRSF